MWNFTQGFVGRINEPDVISSQQSVLKKDGFPLGRRVGGSALRSDAMQLEDVAVYGRHVVHFDMISARFDEIDRRQRRFGQHVDAIRQIGQLLQDAV